MLIECLGAPGCGKTTLARALTEVLQARGERVHLRYREAQGRCERAVRLADKSVHVACAAVRQLSATRDLVRRVHASRQRTSSDIIKLVTMRLYLEEIVTREEPECDQLLLHQGFMQWLYSVGFGSSRPWDELVAEHAATLPRADAYIHVAAPIATLAERVSARTGSGSRLRHQLGDNTHDIELGVARIESLCRLLEADGAHVLHYRYSPDDQLAVVAESMASQVFAAGARASF